MDILGFLDGLFSAFSAARSGKEVDDNKSEKTSLYADNGKQISEQTIQSNKSQIKKARSSKKRNAQYDKDMN